MTSKAFSPATKNLSHDAIVATLILDDPDFDTRTSLQKMGLVPVEDPTEPSTEIAKIDVIVPPKKSAAADLADRAVLGKLTKAEKAALIAKAAAKPDVKVPAKKAAPKKAAAPKAPKKVRKPITKTPKTGTFISLCGFPWKDVMLEVTGPAEPGKYGPRVMVKPANGKPALAWSICNMSADIG
jgi:hypothetical protein